MKTQPVVLGSTLAIRWNCNGEIDTFPQSVFAKTGVTASFAHAYLIKGKKYSAKCKISVHRRHADLDYNAFPKFNRARDNLLGIVRLHFTTGARKAISRFQWKPENRSRFQSGCGKPLTPSSRAAQSVTVGFVATTAQVEANIQELERYRRSSSPEVRAAHLSLVKLGTCFVPYKVGGLLAFAPSKFIGYVQNRLDEHLRGKRERDGRATNQAITKILGSKPIKSNSLEARYASFVRELGAEPNSNGSFGAPRKYWATPDIAAEVAKDEEDAIEDLTLPTTVKRQLRLARVGQGMFRQRVLRQWRGKCCLTGCAATEILRASHIKPWSESNNAERIDPSNGLLLSPNADALFDKGLISFGSSGQLLISPRITHKIVAALLGTNASIMVRPSMKKYLAYHRWRHNFRSR